MPDSRAFLKTRSSGFMNQCRSQGQGGRGRRAIAGTLIVRYFGCSDFVN